MVQKDDIITECACKILRVITQKCPTHPKPNSGGGGRFRGFQGGQLTLCGQLCLLWKKWHAVKQGPRANTKFPTWQVFQNLMIWTWRQWCTILSCLSDNNPAPPPPHMANGSHHGWSICGSFVALLHFPPSGQQNKRKIWVINGLHAPILSRASYFALNILSSKYFPGGVSNQTKVLRIFGRSQHLKHSSLHLEMWWIHVCSACYVCF